MFSFMICKCIFYAYFSVPVHEPISRGHLMGSFLREIPKVLKSSKVMKSEVFNVLFWTKSHIATLTM